MKKLSILILILCLYSCINNDDGTDNPLPPITSEGKNTFGCIIDGQETFLPHVNGWGNPLQELTAKYVYMPYQYNELGPGYQFVIHAYNTLTDKGIHIRLYNFEEPLHTNVTYPIVLESDGSFSAEYSYSTNTADPDNPGIYIYHSYDHITTHEKVGEITFNKIDEENQIISGVFHFECINPENGVVAEITEGRFDVVYEKYF